MKIFFIKYFQKFTEKSESLKTKEKVVLIMNVLDKFYPDPPIPLQHFNAYTMLIAVVLSAQCTDTRVNQVTKILFTKAKSPEEMVKLGQDRIREIIRPCGLSAQKAKALYGLSEILINKFKSKVPSDFESLESLPGVGHKTASVVMSQVFNVPAFPVDTHIHRLAFRWGLSGGKNVVQTEKDLKKLFPEYSWNKLHLQMIYYGREYCPARGHLVENCPICKTITL